MKVFFALLLTTTIFACSTANVAQYPINGVELETARASGTTIEVLEVSLPLYMQGEEIPMMGEDGAIHTDPNAVWADEPARAISLNLAEALSRLSGGVVSVEPWPLDDPASRRLDVRVKTLLAGNDGNLKFSGQYFLVSESGKRPKVEWFDISVPLDSKTGASIANATGLATQQLARQILGRR